MESHSGYWNALSGYCNAAPLHAQPSYSAIQSAPNSDNLFFLIGAGVVVLLVLLSAGLFCLRARSRKASLVNEFHLLESFSVPS
jgi:hypothetical protein